jgi:hypothetical protein
MIAGKLTTHPTVGLYVGVGVDSLGCALRQLISNLPFVDLAEKYNKTHA